MASAPVCTIIIRRRRKRKVGGYIFAVHMSCVIQCKNPGNQKFDSWNIFTMKNVRASCTLLDRDKHTDHISPERGVLSERLKEKNDWKLTFLLRLAFVKLVHGTRETNRTKIENTFGAGRDDIR